MTKRIITKIGDIFCVEVDNVFCLLTMQSYDGF